MPAPSTRQLHVLRYLHAGAAIQCNDRGIGVLRIDIGALRRLTVEQLHDAGWIAPTAPGMYALTDAGREAATLRDRIHDFITDLSN